MRDSLRMGSLIMAGLLLCSLSAQSSDTVYAGLIDAACAMHFMVSKDGGQTWMEQSTPGGWMEIHAIAPVPATPGALYISQGSAIYLSTQYGQNWSDNLFPYTNVSFVHDVEIDPLHLEWLWATSNVRPFSSSDTVGVFLSRDSGSTWEYGGEGIPYIGGACVATYCIAVGSGSPSIGYVGTWEAIGDTTMGVYKRDLSSGTNRWQYSGLRGQGPIKDIAVDPVDQDLCFAITGYCPSSAGGIWRTTDGGDSWEKVLDAASIQGTIDWDFEYSNGVLYVPVWARGMYISTDHGDTWECCSSGLHPAVSCVSVSPQNLMMVYAGCQPSVGPPIADPFYKSIDGGHTWFQSANIGDLLWCVLIKCGYSEFCDVNEGWKTAGGVSAATISPNPCRLSAEISYCTMESDLVTIDLYDLSGRRVEQLFKGFKRSGDSIQRLPTAHLLPGIYFVRISQNGNDILGKFVVLK